MLLLFALIAGLDANVLNLCSNYQCDGNNGDQVCGIRKEGNGYKLKLFPNECALIKYGCEIGTDFAFGLISMFYCTSTLKSDQTNHQSSVRSCDFNCSSTISKVCGIKTDGEGFRVRMFENECQLLKFNCVREVEFTPTNFQICNDIETTYVETNENKTKNTVDYEHNKTKAIVDDEIKTTNMVDDVPNLNKTYEGNSNETKKIFIIDSSMVDVNFINQTIDDFFAATHRLRLPVKEITNISEATRRRLVNIWGPVKVFRPWVVIPDEKLDDYDHLPTLDSCYHKCPRKCPETYAPVCGVPGRSAREPTLMFQNHCYMDVAQCKMFHEDLSSTAKSSTYIESSFFYCLGDQMNGMYRFLPLIRTLQHMGRLKSKGNYHYKVKNMKFFNEYLLRQPKYMG